MKKIDSILRQCDLFCDFIEKYALGPGSRLPGPRPGFMESPRPAGTPTNAPRGQLDLFAPEVLDRVGPERSSITEERGRLSPEETRTVDESGGGSGRGSASPEAGGPPADIKPSEYIEKYQIKIERLNERGLTREGKKPTKRSVTDGEVTIYADAKGKVVKEYLPKEISDLMEGTLPDGTRNNSVIQPTVEKIYAEIAANTHGRNLTEYHEASQSGSFLEKMNAARKLPGSYLAAKGPGVKRTATALATIAILGSLYMFFSGSEPKAEGELGKALKEGSRELSQKAGAGKVLKAADLKTLLSNTKAIAESYKSRTSNQNNITKLEDIIRYIDGVSENLDFGSLDLEDPASQRALTKKFSTLKRAIEKLTESGRLDKFERYAEKNHDTKSASTIRECSVEVSTYYRLLSESNQTVKTLQARRSDI